MSNTYDISAHGLPDPDAMAPGNAIKTAEIRALTGCINHAFAQVYAQPVVSQSWPAKFLERSAGAKADLAEWRVPRLTALHTTLWCEVYAAGGGVNGGTVYFTSAASGSVATIPVAGGGAYAFAGTTLSVGSLATYDDITMSIAASGGTVTITDLHVSTMLYTSPIAQGGTTTTFRTGVTPVTTALFTPCGNVAATADYPLTSSRGRRMLDSLEAIRNGVRQVFCFSGLETSNITGGNNAAEAHPWMGQDVYQQSVPVWTGAANSGARFVMHVKVSPSSTDTTAIILRAGSESGVTPNSDQVISITASAAGDTWATTTFSVPDNRDGGRSIRGLDWPMVTLSVYPAEWDATTKAVPMNVANALLTKTTTARIKSISVWGE